MLKNYLIRKNKTAFYRDANSYSPPKSLITASDEKVMRSVEIHKVPKEEVPQFSYEFSVVGTEFDGRSFFNQSLIASAKPLFNNCQDNYEVERKLRNAGVITDSIETDTESSALWVYFDSKMEAEAFIGRLNDYLQKRAQKINEFIETF